MPQKNFWIFGAQGCSSEASEVVVFFFVVVVVVAFLHIHGLSKIFRSICEGAYRRTLYNGIF